MKWNFLSKGIKSENHDNQYTIYVYTILAGVECALCRNLFDTLLINVLL